jgi:hypothetical protein
LLAHMALKIIKGLTDRLMADTSALLSGIASAQQCGLGRFTPRRVLLDSVDLLIRCH